MTEIVMPRLSDSMEEGTVLKWMKSVGDQIELGEELVEIETDKANMVFESDAAGMLIEILAPEGETLPIGEVIARVGEAEDVGEAAEAASDNGGSAPAPPPDRVKASPVARRIAAGAGLELGSISGSGPGGRIVKADVQRALASGSASTKDHPLSPLSGDSLTSSPAQAGSRSSLENEETPSAQVSHAAPAGSLLNAGDKPETAKGTVEVVELTKLQQTVSRRMAESRVSSLRRRRGRRSLRPNLVPFTGNRLGFLVAPPKAICGLSARPRATDRLRVRRKRQRLGGCRRRLSSRCVMPAARLHPSRKSSTVDKHEEGYEIVWRSLSQMLAAVRPAAMARTSRQLHAEPSKSKSLDLRDFGGRVGHGIGLGMSEPPSLHHGDERVLQPGMYLAIEPNVIVPGAGPIVGDEDVLVTQDGYELLSERAPRELPEVN